MTSSTVVASGLRAHVAPMRCYKRCCAYTGATATVVKARRQLAAPRACCPYWPSFAIRGAGHAHCPDWSDLIACHAAIMKDMPTGCDSDTSELLPSYVSVLRCGVGVTRPFDQGLMSDLVVEAGDCGVFAKPLGETRRLYPGIPCSQAPGHVSSSEYLVTLWTIADPDQGTVLPCVSHARSSPESGRRCRANRRVLRRGRSLALAWLSLVTIDTAHPSSYPCMDGRNVEYRG
jgi:hypothetical protein